MSLIIRTGSLEMFGNQPRHEGFNITRWRGWNDGVSAHQDQVAIPQGDGAYDVPSGLNSREINVEGYCEASSIEKLGWYRRILTGLPGVKLARQITVEVLGNTEWALGKVIDKPEFDEWGGQPFADFSVDFWCPKPQIFGELANVDGPAKSVVANNYGNFPATSVLTINGSMAGGYIINGPLGRKFIVTEPLVTGRPHTIDMVNGNLYVDGALTFNRVSRADTWATPGGGSVVMSITGAGTGTITARTRDTTV